MNNPIIVKTRYGKETHWGGSNSSVTDCGRWLKANGSHFEVRGATSATCEAPACKRRNPRAEAPAYAVEPEAAPIDLGFAQAGATGEIVEVFTGSAMSRKVHVRLDGREDLYRLAGSAVGNGTLRGWQAGDRVRVVHGYGAGARLEAVESEPASEAAARFEAGADTPEPAPEVLAANLAARKEAEALGWNSAGFDLATEREWYRCPACGAEGIYSPAAHVAARIVEAHVWRCFAGAPRLDFGEPATPATSPALPAHGRLDHTFAGSRCSCGLTEHHWNLGADEPGHACRLCTAAEVSANREALAEVVIAERMKERYANGDVLVRASKPREIELVPDCARCGRPIATPAEAIAMSGDRMLHRICPADEAAMA